MKNIFAIIAALLISGCTAYRPINNEKLLTQPPEISKGVLSTTVTVKRDKKFSGSAIDAHFYLNEVHIVTLSRAEAYTFNIALGRHRLGVKSIQPVMMVPTPFYREIEVYLEPGKKYEYIIKNIHMGGLKIEPLN